MKQQTYYQGRPMTFHESLRFCGCDSCKEEAIQRSKTEPPLKPDFVQYLNETYPLTARWLVDA